MRLLLRNRPYLHNEHVLSGPGLMNLYRCLCELRGATPMHVTRVRWYAAATDALARETLETFCGWLGSVVGDLAIIFGARVVYLAGGVTAHIPQFLHDGHFLQRYLNKGVMTEQLERVPVAVVMDSSGCWGPWPASAEPEGLSCRFTGLIRSTRAGCTGDHNRSASIGRT